MTKFQFSCEIERIDNGFVVRDLDSNRAAHVTYDFEVPRQIERFVSRSVRDLALDLENEAALERLIATAPMPQGAG